MAEHFRFAVAFWHTFKGTGTDMFGPAAWVREWNAGSPMEAAEHALRANFEFCQKLGVPFYCFHDRDIAPEGATFAESCRYLEKIVAQAAKLQADTGIRLLWGTANLFSNPRYTHGAATNPDVHIFAYAAAQVKHALEATHALGGQNYVFWGGREGYETLLNTDYRQEQEQFARFLHLAVEHKKKIGFTGQFPTNFYTTTAAMLVVLGQPGGLNQGGFNFDAKCRRGSCDPVDLFHAHIGGMDTFARGLLVAAKLRTDGELSRFVEERYASWRRELGQEILTGKSSLESLSTWVSAHGEPRSQSGRQELLEILINDALHNA